MLEFAGINIPFNTYPFLKGVSLGNPAPEWPIYQANGYGEVFMYDNLSRLRWFPNYETLTLYGYTGAEKKVVPISWFYDKVIGESIRDTKTGKIYPAESTPNYIAYRKPAEVSPPPPVPTPEKVVRQVVCSQCKSVLNIISPSPGTMVTQAFTWLSCPMCGFSKLVQVPTGGFRAEEAFEGITPITPTPTPPDWFTKQINDALDEYENKIEELENALRTAQAAEFYNNPYGTIAAHAQTLLNQLNSYQPTIRWPLAQSTRWVNLMSRIKKLIIDARTIAKERRPVPTYQEATDEQQSQWITDTMHQLQQQGLPWSDIRVSYPQPGQQAINGRAILPVEEGIPPTWKTYTETPVGIPDYSVEERMQSPAGQEPWELAEAPVPTLPKKITPYLILAGLGVTTVAVWYYKKKRGG